MRPSQPTAQLTAQHLLRRHHHRLWPRLRAQRQKRQLQHRGYGLVVIAVMAVDNLPCELPKDASEDFGGELIKHILPALLEDDPTNIIERGSETTKEGELSEHFKYLQDYLEGRE